MPSGKYKREPWMKTRKGIKHTDETKAKLREISINQVRLPYSKETRLKISLALKGKNKSEEHIKNLKIARSKMLIQPMSGKHHSEETKRKISIKVSKLHNAYKGNNIGYYGLHGWIAEKLGTPLKCSNCNKDNVPRKGDGRRTIQWANKYHTYKRNTKDWIALCVKCHGEYDKEKKLRKTICQK